MCRTTRKIGRNCGFGEIPSRLAVKLALLALKVAKATPIGAAPSGNRPEICVGWLSKHAESKAFTVQLQLYPRSHILVSFDGNPRGISTDFSCQPASQPGGAGTSRAKKVPFTVSRDGISPSPKLRAIFQVVQRLEIPLRLTGKAPFWALKVPQPRGSGPGDL